MNEYLVDALAAVALMLLVRHIATHPGGGWGEDRGAYLAGIEDPDDTLVDALPVFDADELLAGYDEGAP